ncbi:response regulator [Phenylobacterium montanum]|uniref:Response regulator n=1 Tax=Phenylobacterium montanum TaxID=2823693 RepID=A0A975FVX2_9CAUL|nr:response regulator [Caulobacter sp. S6]QUD85942.1 response regulator [Caulobacter sp. S6]
MFAKSLPQWPGDGHSRANSDRRSAAGGGPLPRASNDDHLGCGEARSPLRVLLVDDNILTQEVAASVLELEGYAVDQASNGLQAVEAATRTSYDLILMDLQMPVMDGIAATRQIRRLPPPHGEPWIIAVSGWDDPNSRRLCVGVGMDDFIAKPYHPDLLSEKLEWIDAFRPTHRQRPGSPGA